MTIQARQGDFILSGHGHVELATGLQETLVPSGVEFVVLAPPAASISNALGKDLEEGLAIEALKVRTATGSFSPTHAFRYPAGSKAPNYVLSPPNGLDLGSGPATLVTVGAKTALKDLWSRVKVGAPGTTIRCFWAACTALEEAGNQIVVNAATLK